jgi:hypothetical protein
LLARRGSLSSPRLIYALATLRIAAASEPLFLVTLQLPNFTGREWSA